MPQVFKIGSYWVYFWTNENEPLEPIHVHVSQGSPRANATKIWITRAGKCYLCHNNSHIPGRILYRGKKSNCCEQVARVFWKSELFLLIFIMVM